MLVKVTQRTVDEALAGATQQGLLVPCVSPAMRVLELMIADLATVELPVLLLGETGTGKEVVAVKIHDLSRRRKGPFLKLRCSSLKPEDFSRLQKTGNEERAGEQSTVFLDEISDLNSACQARLLEAFTGSNGGPEKFQLGACVISSTCQDLEGAMQRGHFRDDLYYRLGGVCLRLPPLRERREDILPLANFFLDRYSEAFARPRPELSAVTVHWLQGYSWPGNVRELENTIKRLVALGDEGLTLKGTGAERQALLAQTGDGDNYSLKQVARSASREAEKELILKALFRNRWNRKRAAEELQISYKALLYKLKQIGVGQLNQ